MSAGCAGIMQSQSAAAATRSHTLQKIIPEDLQNVNSEYVSSLDRCSTAQRSASSGTGSAPTGRAVSCPQSSAGRAGCRQPWRQAAPRHTQCRSCPSAPSSGTAPASSRIPTSRQGLAPKVHKRLAPSETDFLSHAIVGAEANAQADGKAEGATLPGPADRERRRCLRVRHPTPPHHDPTHPQGLLVQH